MLRWLSVLLVLTLLSGLLGFGLIPIGATGLARSLFEIYAGILLVTLIFGIIRS